MNTKTRCESDSLMVAQRSTNDKYVKLLALISFEYIYYKFSGIYERDMILKSCRVQKNQPIEKRAWHSICWKFKFQKHFKAGILVFEFTEITYKTK